MLPALISVLVVMVALAAGAYAIRQAGEHGRDMREAVLLLLVLCGLAATLGMTTFYPDWAMGRTAQPEKKGARA